MGTVILCSWTGVSADSPRQAKHHMERGQYGEAIRIYEELASKHPKDARYLYNAGVAAYKSLKFDQAQEFFDAASLSSDLNLQQQSFYNRGNALYKAGEVEANLERKTQMWKEAIDQFDHAVQLDENDQRAVDNMNFVKQALEKLKQEQEQNQEQEAGEDQNDESNQDNQQDQQNQSNQNQEDQDNQQQDPSQGSGNQEQEQNQPSPPDENSQQGDESTDSKENPEKEEQESQGNRDNSGDQENQDNTEGQESAEEPISQTTMTPQQAMQLLESEKDEAKALIFQTQKNRRPKRFKDW